MGGAVEVYTGKCHIVSYVGNASCSARAPISQAHAEPIGQTLHLEPTDRHTCNSVDFGRVFFWPLYPCLKMIRKYE